MSTLRVLRTAKATLARTFYLDEVATDASGAVIVTITREDGTVLQSGGATGPDVNHQYTYLFNGSDVVDRVTVSWTATVGGDAVVLDQDQIEIAGGFYFGLAEARSTDAVFSNTTKYPTADAIEARTQTEDEAERICGQAFVPRYEREVLTGTLDRPLRLKWPLLRKVRAMSVAGYALTSADLLNIGADPLGLIRTSRPWGVGSIVVEYEHGMDRPPAEMVRGTKIRWRSLMFERRTRTPLPDRSEAFARSESGLVKYGMEDVDSTGIPGVDAIYRRWQSPRPGFG